MNDDDTFKIDLPGGIVAPPIQSSSSPGLRPAPPASRTDRTIPIVEQSPEQPEESPEQPPEVAGDSGRGSSTTGSASSRQDDPESDEPEPVRPPSSAARPGGPRSNRDITVEVTESPAGKPGSGHRVRISQPESPKADSTSEEGQPSSPLAGKIRRSDVSVRPRPSIPAVPEESEEEAEPTDIRPPFQPPKRPRQVSVEEEDPEESDHSDEEAIEIEAKEAAKSISQKRPRPSVQASPSLGSEDEEEDDDAEEIPAPKRIRKSPAIQRQPTKRPKPSPRRKRRPSSSSEDNEAEIVEITVQRFINNFTTEGGEDEELQQEIPFANRGGETVVDVFAQVCEDVMVPVLDQFEELLRSTEDASKKKEYRIKMRAIAAYREELNSRLLQHVSFYCMENEEEDSG